MDAATVLTRFSSIARAITGSTTTTVPLDLLPDLIRVAAGLDAGDILTGAIGYPGQTRGTNYMGLPIIDAGAARAKVAGILAALAAGDAGNGGEPAADECG